VIFDFLIFLVIFDYFRKKVYEIFSSTLPPRGYLNPISAMLYILYIGRVRDEKYMV